MKRNMKTRLFSGLIALCMLLTFLPTTAFAADGDVAQVGDKTYATLDEAVAAAGDGSTIELLADAMTAGMNLSKNLTIKGADGLAEKPTITFTDKGIALWGKELTFENCDVIMNGITSTPYTAEWSWVAICSSENSSITLKNVDMVMDADPDGNELNGSDAIYFTANSSFNITNSTLKIYDYKSNALEWNGGSGYNVNINNSTFISDHNRSGFAGTFYATITDSDVDVINSTGNGSNGSDFIITDSNVNFSNNGSHGLSARNLSITNSVLNCNENGMYGITYFGEMTMDETSVINVKENASVSGGGLRAANSSTISTVEAGAEINILDNLHNGLENYGTFTMEDGVKLTITGNNERTTNGGGIYNGGTLVLPSTAVIMNNSAHQTGGGICNAGTVTIPVGVKLYNNHAGTAGDDLYNRNGANATLTDVGDMWVLDDCDHLIDGWYDDAEGTRWEAHAETDDGNHMEEFTDFSEETGLATISGLTSLKAAHGKDPIDKTSFPGLDKVIVTEEGDKKEDTAAAGDTVDFKLTSNVPDDLLNYIKPEEADDPEVVNTLANVPVEDRGEYKLTFHDDMNDMFIDPTNFVVKVGDDELIQPDQYTINYEPAQHEDGTTCDFEITVDLVNLYEMGAIDDEDIANATPITVTYTATLSEEATAGSYQNTAWVTYPDGETEKSIVKVNTYKIDVFKYDQTNEEKGLEGAKFEFYQKDGEGNPINVVVELTSDANGHIILDGLDAGVYYLKETEAPEGYVCSNEELTITIPDQADASNVVTVKFANSPVPHTGGTGTMLFTVGGMGILAAAGAVMVVPRKFRKKEEC